MTKLRQACVGVFLIGSAACVTGRPPPAPDGVIPTVKAITIYSAGGSVVSGTIAPTAIGSQRLRVPASVTAINLGQGNESLKWFTVQPVQPTRPDKDRDKDRDKDDKKDDRRRDSDDKPEEPYKLIGLPSLSAGELKFNYALPDITWSLRLKADIVDAKSASLQLLAMVNMNGSEPYQNCDVTLVLNNSVSVERLSGSTFKLASFDLYPHRNVTYSLGNKMADYSFIREWNANSGRDDVHVLMQVRNPFTVDLNSIASSVEANEIIIESGSISSESGPGETIELPAGIDDTISTFRSVKILEATDKRLLPFNHHVAYTITNHSDQKKMLRLVTSRVMGNEHRSVYHFTEAPDATPDNTLVWNLQLEPGSTRTLEFDFDSDVKDVDGENGFEAGG